WVHRGPGSRLTKKKLLFAEFYLADPERNGARAARKAGYSAKRAKTEAYELLNSPDMRHNGKVYDLITGATEEARQRLALTAEYVLSNIRETYERNRHDPGPGNQMVALRALELLGKHLRV